MQVTTVSSKKIQDVIDMLDRLMDLFIPICLENVGTIFAKKEITLSPKSHHSIQMRIEPLFKLPVLLVLVFSGSLIGATFALGQATISVQTGGSFTTWGGDDVKELEDAGFDIGYRTGVAVRASVVSPLTDLLGLQIGAAYVQKGASGEVDEDDFYLEFTTDMDYLEFPLLLRFSPQLGGAAVAPRRCGSGIFICAQLQG
ncbi:MAG: PorT family protein [Rhodothermaceae bacterium]|nr:PorT family protein [Rhodothermaceae bacterium]